MRGGVAERSRALPAFGSTGRARWGMECRPEAMYHPPKLLKRVPEGPSSATAPKALQPTVRALNRVNGA